MAKAKCAIAGCERPANKRQWCNPHYSRGLRDGSIVALPKKTLAERFWEKVDTAGPTPDQMPELGSCWTWNASLDDDGYGRFAVRKNGHAYSDVAHRVSWEIAHGGIPDGLKIDHICHRPSCVRPEHLRVVTHKQNLENRAGAQSNNHTSGIRGVCWNRRIGKWCAQIRHDGQQLHVGFYDDISEAERAVVARRNQLFTHNDMDRLAA